jgi:hypothetical protein
VQVSAENLALQEGLSKSYGLGTGFAKGVDTCSGPRNHWTGLK